MAFLNYSKKEIDAKIVYYGPALCGKTTNVKYIHGHMKPEQRGKLVSIATQTDRTLFFDFLPVELGEIKGFKTRFHIYTVPGQVIYNATRRAVLTGVDGIVFVADSQRERLEDNIESIKNLEDNLATYGKRLRDIPHVMQYNKRDLPNILPVEELDRRLNRYGVEYFEAVAVRGKGVLETLTAICKSVLKSLRKETGMEEIKEKPEFPKEPEHVVDFGELKDREVYESEAELEEIEEIGEEALEVIEDELEAAEEPASVERVEEGIRAEEKEPSKRVEFTPGRVESTHQTLIKIPVSLRLPDMDREYSFTISIGIENLEVRLIQKESKGEEIKEVGSPKSVSREDRKTDGEERVNMEGDIEDITEDI